MDIKVVDEKGEEVVQEQTEPKEPTSETVPTGEIEIQQMAELFDMKPSDIGRDKNKIQTLIDFAKVKTDDHSIDGLKWALRDTMYRLKTPQLGERMLPYMYRYAKLYLETKQNEKKIHKYYD